MQSGKGSEDLSLLRLRSVDMSRVSSFKRAHIFSLLEWKECWWRVGLGRAMGVEGVYEVGGGCRSLILGRNSSSYDTGGKGAWRSLLALRQSSLFVAFTICSFLFSRLGDSVLGGESF